MDLAEDEEGNQEDAEEAADLSVDAREPEEESLCKEGEWQKKEQVKHDAGQHIDKRPLYVWIGLCLKAPGRARVPKESVITQFGQGFARLV